MAPPAMRHERSRPASRLTPRQVDLVLASALAAGSIAMLTVAAAATHRPDAWIGFATLPVAVLPLCWRRSRPGTVLAAITGAVIISALFGWPLPHVLGLVAGGYSAALYGDRRVRTIGGATAAVALIVAFGVLLNTHSATGLEHLTGAAFGYGVAWVLGDRTRVRRAYLAELVDRAARLERERDESAQRAADEERARIARELHDIVSHNVSVIAVQAGAARITGHSHDTDEQRVLELIEHTARDTLAELRVLLGILRHGSNSAAPRHPRPTVAQLDELISQATDAGLQVNTRIQGDTSQLPSLIDACAYRIIQESLTNAIKHAPAATVQLTIDHRPSCLLINVTDHGPGTPDAGTPDPGTPDPGSLSDASLTSGSAGHGVVGHGLIGMRERVALVGGLLRIGPTPDGGFGIAARLPLTNPSTTATTTVLAAHQGQA